MEIIYKNIHGTDSWMPKLRIIVNPELDKVEGLFKVINLVPVVIDPKVNTQRNYMCFPQPYTAVSFKLCWNPVLCPSVEV